MGAPDMWIHYFKNLTDEAWNMGHLVHTLTNRRSQEKVLCYSESHDQAIVGDQTISCRLFGENFYQDLNKSKQISIKASRGIALHKMIRLLT